MESLLPVLAHKAAGGGLALHGGGSLAEVAGDGKTDWTGSCLGSRAPWSRQMSREAKSPQPRGISSPEPGRTSFLN